MEKHLGEIISKEEATQIVLHAIGRKATEQEIQGVEIVFIDEYKDTSSQRLRMLSQQMIIPITLHENVDDAEMKIVVSANGLVQYQNWSGCTYPLLNPIEVYKIILSKEEDFKNLAKSV